MNNLTASIGNRQAYIYQCGEHPECGGPELWHAVDPLALQEMRDRDDPEYYFVASHIDEVWDKEWDWDNPVPHDRGLP